MDTRHAIGCECVFCLRAEAKRISDAKREQTIKDAVAVFERTMQCCCDLDNWEPEPLYGHSWVCRIYKAARATEALGTKGAKDAQ